MRIDIYSKYKIKFYSECSYISEEDSEPGDIVFNKDEFKKEQILSGGTLLKVIGESLLDKEISEIKIDDNKITTKTSIPDTGEGSIIKMEFERIEECE